MSGTGSLSKEMMDLVKAIGEARSKQEEDKIIETEAQKLKDKFREKSITENKMKDLLIRTIYVEMLGHDGGFAHIHAINMTQKKNILYKRIGYLASTLFLDKDNELLILLVATLQRDLESESYLEVLSSLHVISRLANSQIMTATYDQVIKLLAHPSDFVRKKAIMVLNRFWQINPSQVVDIDLRMKSALCDKVPSVMAASLNYFVDVCKKNPENYKVLASSFSVILKQVIEHKLPKEYDYHRMPAPWIQMKILEILAYLGKDDKDTSSDIYEVVQMTLKRAEDLSINIGHALVYQCIKTILTIYPNESLLENISKSIKSFFSSESNNLKYIGVNCLNAMLKIDLKYAEDHQDNVVECLECSDDTLKLKTLDLLFTMTNKDNVEAIIEKMLEHLKAAPTDSKIRRDLVKKIYQSVEKFSSSKTWFVKTINRLFEMGADLIPLDISNKFITVICEHEAESSSKKFRDSIIKIYKSLLKKSPYIFDSHMQVIVYILGEYAPRVKDKEKAVEILNLLCDSCNRPFEKHNTYGWILSSITKIHSSLGFASNAKVDSIIEKFRNSKETHLQQRVKEYLEIKSIKSSNSYNIEECLFTSFAEYKEDKYDFELDFLSDYIQKEVEEGVKTYDQNKHEEAVNITGTHDTSSKELNFTPYEKPTRNAVNIKSQPRVEKPEPISNEPKLIVKGGNKKGKWTAKGYIGPEDEKSEVKPKTFDKPKEEAKEEPKSKPVAIKK